MKTSTRPAHIQIDKIIIFGKIYKMKKLLGIVVLSLLLTIIFRSTVNL